MPKGYFHQTILWIRKRKNQFTKPAEKVEVPPTKRRDSFWYDKNYYCSTCKKFYDRKTLYEKYYCGVCKDKTRRVRLQSRRGKSDSIREHYNEKYI